MGSQKDAGHTGEQLVTFGLSDVSFAHCEYSNGPTPAVHAPRKLRWDRSGRGGHSATLVTDHMIPSFAKQGTVRPIAWLLEPMVITGGLYQWVAENHRRFWAVLSHDVDFFSGRTADAASDCMPPGFRPYGTGPSNFLWVPFGGCWIPKASWQRPSTSAPKEKGVNIIASDKRMTAGHAMRHDAIGWMSDRSIPLSVRGRGYSPVERKEEAMGHRFQLVFENDRRNGYFTEKLIDCLACGVVPIYWGCPDLEKYGFRTDGMLHVSTLEEAMHAVVLITGPDGEKLYSDMAEAREHNFNVATTKYVLAEDYIYDNYLSHL